MRSMGWSMSLDHVVAFSRTGSIEISRASSRLGDGLVHSISIHRLTSLHTIWPTRWSQGLKVDTWTDNHSGATKEYNTSGGYYPSYTDREA